MPPSEFLGPTAPAVSRVRLRNYKSIATCDVGLRSLTILVGRNGSGKSNFLDSLRFVVDGLQTSLDHAMKSRGGIDAVRRRSTGHPTNFAIDLDVSLPNQRRASYGFEISARKGGGFAVKRERLRVLDAANRPLAHYTVDDATIAESSEPQMPAPVSDRLFLVAASSLSTFRPVYDALSAMGFYNLNPEAMKELQSPDAGELLHRDGGNVASVVARLEADKPAVKDRIKAYLATIVSGIEEFQRVALGPRETLQFHQKVVGASHPWRFYAANMSDGTLRALGILVAATQLADRATPIRLVGIEEPETALHPAAAGSLMDALKEAASHTQVIVTSHSPDLLDQVEDHDALLVVVSRDGTTEIAPASPSARTALRKHLYTAGDLLRMDQLEPDEADLKNQRQLRLFESDEAGT